jgi:hypothetical protein
MVEFYKNLIVLKLKLGCILKKISHLPQFLTFRPIFYIPAEGILFKPGFARFGKYNHLIN